MRYATRYPIPLKLEAGFGLVVERDISTYRAKFQVEANVSQ